MTVQSLEQWKRLEIWLVIRAMGRAFSSSWIECGGFTPVLSLSHNNIADDDTIGVHLEQMGD